MTDGQQLLLPFDFLEQEKQICWDNLPHFEEPRTDNERLLELQYQYRVNGDQKALERMYRIAVVIAAKYISTMGQNNWKIRSLDEVQKEEKAHQAVTYMISIYLRKPRWAINDSWTGYLWRAVQKQLLGHRKVDGIVDFVDMDEFYKERDDELAEELQNGVENGNYEHIYRQIYDNSYRE